MDEYYVRFVDTDDDLVDDVEFAGFDSVTGELPGDNVLNFASLTSLGCARPLDGGFELQAMRVRPRSLASDVAEAASQPVIPYGRIPASVVLHPALPSELEGDQPDGRKCWEAVWPFLSEDA